jgi:hypothetical protein
MKKKMTKMAPPAPKAKKTNDFENGERVEIVGYEPLEGIHGVVKQAMNLDRKTFMVEANVPFWGHYGRNLFGVPVEQLKREAKDYPRQDIERIRSAKVEPKPELEVRVGLIGGQICCSKLPEGVKLTIW